MNTDGPADERRNFQRANFTILVKLRIVSEDEDREHEREVELGGVGGITTDLSRGGLGAWIGEKLEPKSRCLVRFLNPGGRVQPAMSLGTVRRLRSDGDGCLVGIEFEKPLHTFTLGENARARVTVQRAPRILVADDQPEIRHLLYRFLSQRGFDVNLARDGEETLEAIRRNPPDVVLLDLCMPGLGGHDVLRQLREDDVEVDVITISGYATDEDARECLRLGAVDHLPKPLDLEHLDWNLRLRQEPGEVSSSDTEEPGPVS